MIENRETVRYPHEHRIAYCASHDLLPRSGRLNNISREGACLFTREPFELNQRLTLSVPFEESDHPLTVTGSVRWLETSNPRHNQFAVGLRWLPLDQRSDTLLEELIDWKTEHEPPSRKQRRAWSDRPLVREIKTVKPGGLLALALFLISYGFSLALFAGYQRDRVLRMESGFELKQSLLKNETLRLRKNLHEASRQLSELRTNAEASAGGLNLIGSQLSRLTQEAEALSGLTAATVDTANSAEREKQQVEEKLTTLQKLLVK